MLQLSLGHFNFLNGCHGDQQTMKTEMTRVFGQVSDIGAACRVGTYLAGLLDPPFFLYCLGDTLRRGGARVALTSHEGEHAIGKKYNRTRH